MYYFVIHFCVCVCVYLLCVSSMDIFKFGCPIKNICLHAFEQLQRLATTRPQRDDVYSKMHIIWNKYSCRCGVRRRNTRVLYARFVRLYIYDIKYISLVCTGECDCIMSARRRGSQTRALHWATGIWRDVWPHHRRRHDEKRKVVVAKISTKMAVGMKNRSCFVGLCCLFDVHIWWGERRGTMPKISIKIYFVVIQF